MYQDLEEESLKLRSDFGKARISYKKIDVKLEIQQTFLFLMQNSIFLETSFSVLP